MLTLKDYIRESYLKEEKNLHMSHLEELVFASGATGTRKVINFLQDLRDMLSGHSKTKVTATVKWDGSPAVFCGIDPTDGKFFVAKKGIFNKNPKVYKTEQDIDEDTSGDLNEKLKVALQELSKLGIKSGVYQGDIMFTSDTKSEVIDNEKYITFHPNTILYAVPYDSELGQRIRKAKIGVVFHTTYVGTSFETMSASFGKTIVDKFKTVHSVWMDDVNYKDYSGNATLTVDETKEINTLLSRAGTLFNSISAPALNAISKDEDLLMVVSTFNNSIIRKGETITNTKQHVNDLYNYIHDKYEKEIGKKKTEAGKNKQEQLRSKILQFFNSHDRNQIVAIFDLVNILVEAKQLLINKMNQAGHIKTFLKTRDGFKVTGVEGFVAIDHLTGGAVKIVDRMSFSMANFDNTGYILKGWQK